MAVTIVKRSILEYKCKCDNCGDTLRFAFDDDRLKDAWSYLPAGWEICKVETEAKTEEDIYAASIGKEPTVQASTVCLREKSSKSCSKKESISEKESISQGDSMAAALEPSLSGMSEPNLNDKSAAVYSATIPSVLPEALQVSMDIRHVCSDCKELLALKDDALLENFESAVTLGSKRFAAKAKIELQRRFH